jgi:hypothetical protein
VIKSRRMRWAGHFSAYGWEERDIQGFWWGILRERDNLADPSVDGRIITWPHDDSRHEFMTWPQDMTSITTWPHVMTSRHDLTWRHVITSQQDLTNDMTSRNDLTWPQITS